MSFGAKDVIGSHEGPSFWIPIEDPGWMDPMVPLVPGFGKF